MVTKKKKPETQAQKLSRLGAKEFAVSEKALAAKGPQPKQEKVKAISPSAPTELPKEKEGIRKEIPQEEKKEKGSFLQLPTKSALKERIAAGESPLLAARAIRSEDTAATLGVAIGAAGAGAIATPLVGIAAAATAASSIAGGISGVDTIATWAAVDNFSSSIAFQMNDVLAGFNEGSISVGEAIGLLEQAQRQMDTAQRFVDESTRRNPVLWPTRRRYMATVKNNQDSLDLKRARIENAISVRQEAEGGQE